MRRSNPSIRFNMRYAIWRNEQRAREMANYVSEKIGRDCCVADGRVPKCRHIENFAVFAGHCCSALSLNPSPPRPCLDIHTHTRHNMHTTNRTRRAAAATKERIISISTSLFFCCDFPISFLFFLPSSPSIPILFVLFFFGASTSQRLFLLFLIPFGEPNKGNKKDAARQKPPIAQTSAKRSAMDALLLPDTTIMSLNLSLSLWLSLVDRVPPRHLSLTVRRRCCDIVATAQRSQALLLLSASAAASLTESTAFRRFSLMSLICIFFWILGPRPCPRPDPHSILAHVRKTSQQHQ